MIWIFPDEDGQRGWRSHSRRRGGQQDARANVAEVAAADGEAARARRSHYRQEECQLVVLWPFFFKVFAISYSKHTWNCNDTWRIGVFKVLGKIEKDAIVDGGFSAQQQKLTEYRGGPKFS